MKNSEKPKESEAIERGRRAESLLADIFEQAGWRVEREPYCQRSRLDMIVRRPGVVYAVEVKAAVEGRGDRLVPSLPRLCSSHCVVRARMRHLSL